MAAQPTHTTRQGKPKRTHRARHYSDAVWREYYDEVHSMYLDPVKPCTLEEMSLHFRVQYGFSPSKKQWKERLSKWSFQRNLDLQIAAIILFLFQEAARDGVRRRVWHNGRERTRKDVASYITKSAKVFSEDQLLTQLPPRSRWPQSVRFEDEAVNNHSATSNAPEAGTSGLLDSYALYQRSASIPADIFGSHPRQLPQQNSFSLPSAFFLPPQPLDLFEATRDTFDSSFGEPLGRLNYNMPQQDWNLHLQQTLQNQLYQQWDNIGVPQQEWQQYPVPQPQPAGATNANNFGPSPARSPVTRPPHRSPAVSAVWNALESPGGDATNDSMQLEMFNAAASATPASLLVIPGGSNAKPEQQLTYQVRHIMGNIDDLDRRFPSEHFMYYCSEAMLYTSQDAGRQRDQAIRQATDAFYRILSEPKGFSTTLPLLNRLSFVTEAYGHKALKQRIFQSLRTTLQGSIPDVQRRDLLLDILDFLLDTAEWTDAKHATNKARADRIYDFALSKIGITSRFAIAARFNQAWVLMEQKEFAEALVILLQERGRCEGVYGAHALQTICWLASLARAHLMLHEAQTALLLMEESVVPRAERAFNREHPFYWEIRSRMGVFLCKLANNKTIPSRTEDFWSDGEAHLTEVLVWRAKNLGPDLSQTLKSLQILNYYLGRQGKKQNAQDLIRWYRADASDADASDAEASDN